MNDPNPIPDDDAKGLIRAFAEAPAPMFQASGLPPPPEDPACRERYDALLRRMVPKDSKL